ncbi:hypothetical protein FAVG1_12234 [Fusarium avenaceum]|nr:hypothetical protein FAVG1_12234 [Fusarium avenaceum]
MGCFPSTLKDQKDGHDKLSDTSSTHSSGKADSTTVQVNPNNRQESEDKGQAPNQPCDDPPSPRTAFAERLWAYWHETECPDFANSRRLDSMRHDLLAQIPATLSGVARQIPTGLPGIRSRLNLTEEPIRFLPEETEPQM